MHDISLFLSPSCIISLSYSPLYISYSNLPLSIFAHIAEILDKHFTDKRTDKAVIETTSLFMSCI